MKWHGGETKKAKRNRLSEWHKYFAWHPVVVGYSYNGRKIKCWMCYVERQGKHDSYFSDFRNWRWEYRELERTQETQEIKGFLKIWARKKKE
jgi:hypothetical protein